MRHEGHGLLMLSVTSTMWTTPLLREDPQARVFSPSCCGRRNPLLRQASTQLPAVGRPPVWRGPEKASVGANLHGGVRWKLAMKPERMTSLPMPMILCKDTKVSWNSFSSKRSLPITPSAGAASTPGTCHGKRPSRSRSASGKATHAGRYACAVTVYGLG